MPIPSETILKAYGEVTGGASQKFHEGGFLNFDYFSLPNVQF